MEPLTVDVAFLAELRRDLHAHPELRFEEHRTSALVAEYLQNLGYAPHTGLAGTGVVATLDTGIAGPAIMLRADMDALPVSEAGQAPWASCTPGSCMPVGMMGTPPCCSVQRHCLKQTHRHVAGYTLFSSLRKRAGLVHRL